MNISCINCNNTYPNDQLDTCETCGEHICNNCQTTCDQCQGHQLPTAPHGRFRRQEKGLPRLRMRTGGRLESARIYHSRNH